MAGLNVIRIIVQIFATIFTLVGIGLIAAAILSSGWQIMIEPGVGEIHQHGLWMDYVYSNRFHMAGAPAPSVAGYNGYYNGYYNSPLSGLERGGGYANPAGGYGGGFGDVSGYYGYNIAPGGQWIMTYKFGTATYGDAVHQAMPYQVYALVLLVLALLLAVVGVMISYCATVKAGLAIAWAVLLLLAVILGAAALIQFYVSSMLPEYRFAYTDRRLQQWVGYSYYWAVAGMVGVVFGLIGSIAVAIILGLMARRGEKAERAALVFRKGTQTPV